MASRDLIARALAQLQGTPGYRDYVQTIESERESAIHKLLYATTDVEALRGEARSYDKILTQLKNNQGILS